MNYIKSLFLLLACAALVGCAGTASRVQTEYRPAAGEKFNLKLAAPANTSAEALQILRDRLTSQLSGRNLLADAADGKARTIDVVVTNYYMRHGATRAMVGILAGADNVRSTVTIKDTATGRSVSEFTVESKNPSAWGTSRAMLEEHADKIVQTLTGK